MPSLGMVNNTVSGWMSAVATMEIISYIGPNPGPGHQDVTAVACSYQSRGLLSCISNRRSGCLDGMWLQGGLGTSLGIPLISSRSRYLP